MNGGDTNLGGPQVAPSSPTPPTPGPQPASSASSSSTDSSPILSIPHSDKSPSQPLIIKAQTPTPQPDTPSPTPSVAASPAPSPSPSVPTPDTRVDHTPTASATPQPITPTPAPTTISTETFSAPTPVVTGAYYGNNASMPTQTYPSGYTSPVANPAMQTYVSQYPTSTDIYTQDDQEFIELSGSTPQPQKSKKWWIIGAAIGVLAVIAIVLGVVMATVGGGSTAKDTKVLLNIYSNYLLYGVESNEPIIESLEVWNADQIKEKLTNEDAEAKEMYFGRLIELFAKFKESYDENAKLQEEIGEDEVERAGDVISGTMGALGLLNQYAGTQDITEEDMVDMYFNIGGASMVTQVTEFYSDFAMSDSSVKSSYGDSKIGLADSLRLLYSTYERLGCINDKIIIQECLMDEEESQRVQGYLNNIDKYTSTIDNAEWHIINDTISLSSMTYMALVQGYGQGAFENDY